MKRNLLRVLALGLCILMVLSTAACNKNNGEDSSKGSTQSDSSGEKTAELELFKVESGLELPKIVLADKEIHYLGTDLPQFRSPEDRNNQSAEGVVYDFLDKYYGGKIVTEIVPPSDVYTILASKIMSGDSPDVVGAMGGFPTLPLQDMIEPVDGMLNFDLNILKNLKTPYDQYVLGGKHYYLPWVSDVLSLCFYNKSIFEENEMPTPKELYKQGKWDWDAFKDAAIKLTVDEDGDGKPERWGTQLCIWHDARWAFSTGKNIVKIDGDNIESNLNDPDLERAFTYLADLTITNKVADPNRDFNHGKEMFDNGKAAMYLAPDYFSGEAFPELRKAKKLEWVPYPKDPKADKYYVAGESIGFYMPKGADNKDGVRAFIYSAIAALTEMQMPGAAAYEKEKNKFLKKWDMYTEDEYDEIQAFGTEYNSSLHFVIDAYRDMLDIDLLYVQLIGVNSETPLTYQQAVGLNEPIIKDNIEKMKAISTGE